MNRLMSRRKGLKEDQNIPVVPSLAKAFKKNRKPEQLAPPEPPKLDFAELLPSTDDFRTSLLMPSLSARFSMLREQDDPTSKLGKANDDSVLFPKRASRLNLFNSNHPGLSDIAEVSSYRAGSYCSQSESPNAESGTSIMERPRPAEGNILFAGRQKIYKIPAKKDASSHDSYDGESRGLSGKIVYGDDVTDSLFRKWTRENLERERCGDLESKQGRSPSDSCCPADSTRSTSPSNRASASATSVGSQSHGSDHGTAASSVVNLPVNSHNPSPRQTLAAEDSAPRPVQHEQKSPVRSAPPTKPDSLSSRRSPPSAISSAKANQISASEKVGELRNNPRPSQPLPLKRAPSSADSRNYALTRNASVSCDGSRRRQRSISPTMQFAADGTPLVAALKPEDHGKATALGIFNRPTNRDFDEDEYMRLQRKLYEGRTSPPGTLRRSPTEPMVSTESVAHSPNSGPSHHPIPAGASTGLSPAAMRQQFFQNAGTGRQDVKPTPPALPPGQPQQHPSVLLGGCDEARLRCAVSGGRSHKGNIDMTTTPLSPSGESELSTIRENDNTFIKDSDDGLLSPQKAGLGLRNLVRANLRPESEISVMTSTPSTSPGSPYPSNGKPQAPVPDLLRIRTHDETGSPLHNDVPRQMTDYPKPRPQASASPYVPQSESDISNDIGARAKQILEQANALRGQHLQRENEAGTNMDQYPGSITPEHRPTDMSSSPSPPQRNYITRNISRHRREGSVETQMEREDLASDLAERRRLLQKKLKNAAMEQERSNSPKSNTRLPPGPSGFSSILKGRSRPAGLSREPSPQRQKKYLNSNASATSITNEESRESRSRTPRPTTFTRTDEATASRCSPRTANFPTATQSARPSLETVQGQGTCPDHLNSAAPGGRPRGSSRSLASPPPPPRSLPPELPSGVSPTTVDTPYVRTPTVPAFSANTTPPVYDSDGNVIPSSSPQTPNSLDAHRRPVDKSQISEPVLVSTSNQSPTFGLPPVSSVPEIPPMSSRRRRTSHSTRMGPMSGPFESAAASRLPQTSLDYPRYDESIPYPGRSNTRKQSNDSQKSLPRSRSGTHNTPPRSLSPPLRPVYLPLGEQLQDNMF